MQGDLDKCKEMININMQRDVDYDKMTTEERESLVGPERLTSIHRALQEVGVSHLLLCDAISFPITHSKTNPLVLQRAESQEDIDCYSFDYWSAR